MWQSPIFSWSFQRFHCLIPTFAGIADSVNKKLRKIQLQTFDNLTNEERTRMKTIQKIMIYLLVLALPHAKGRYTVDTDASNKEFGAVLLQIQPVGPPEPIEYSFKIAHPSLMFVQNDRARMLCGRMGILALRISFVTKSIYRPYRPLCTSVDSRSLQCNWETRTMTCAIIPIEIGCSSPTWSGITGSRRTITTLDRWNSRKPSWRRYSCPGNWSKPTYSTLQERGRLFRQ